MGKVDTTRFFCSGRQDSRSCELDAKTPHEFALTRCLLLALNRAHDTLAADVEHGLMQFGVNALQLQIPFEFAHERANSPRALVKRLIDTESNALRLLGQKLFGQ